MSTKSLLSNELAKARSLAAGGAEPRDLLRVLEQWEMKLPERRRPRGSVSLLSWKKKITAALTEGERLGVPASKMLEELHPMVREEERQWLKLTSIEKQYGAQGAIAMVMPWGVAFLTGGMQDNFFTWAGAGLQCIGLIAFYIAVMRATRPRETEAHWLRDLLTTAWARLLCGQTLWESLSATINAPADSHFIEAWQGWLKAAAAGSEAKSFDKAYPRSAEASAMLFSLLRSGAPATRVLSDWIRQLDDECRLSLEERIGGIPTTISMIFCVLFTPAVFLILAGTLWPILSPMLK